MPDNLAPSRGAQIVAFVTAFLFGAVASTSLVVERIAHGESTRGWLISAAIMFCAVLLVIANRVTGGSAPAPSRRALLLAQLIGVAVAILVAHWVLIPAAGRSAADLVESPQQMVNDAVLVFAIFGLARSASAVRIVECVTWMATAFALVAIYSRTAPHWHCDHFEGLAVQRYVISQVTASADGLFVVLAVRAFGARRDHR